MQYVAYVAIALFVALLLGVLLRRRYIRRYDKLSRRSFPKNGGWYTTEDIHRFAKMRNKSANQWSIFAALLRHRRNGNVEGRRKEDGATMEWRWKT